MTFSRIEVVDYYDKKGFTFLDIEVKPFIGRKIGRKFTDTIFYAGRNKYLGMTGKFYDDKTIELAKMIFLRKEALCE